MEKFSIHQIKRLKANAKTLARAKNIKLSQALDELAQKFGVSSWALLIHAAKLPSIWPATEAGLQAALSAFVEGLHDSALYGLASDEGSIWVYQDHFISGRLHAASFEVLGRANHGGTQQWAWRQNLVLALDLKGVASAYIFAGDENVFYARDQQIYSHESFRNWLLEMNSKGGVFDAIAQEVEAVYEKE